MPEKTVNGVKEGEMVRSLSHLRGDLGLVWELVPVDYGPRMKLKQTRL